MALKKVVLITALVVLAMPAAALADGITFGLGGGLIVGADMNAVQPSAGAIGTSATNVSTPARLAYVSRFSGNTVPGGGTAPGSGTLPPQIAPTFGSMTTPNTFDFGSASWTTGTASAFSATSVTYDAGGSITIAGNGSLPGTGAVLFSGTFIGPTTLAAANVPGSPSCLTCNFWYTLSGPVSGTIDPGLLALLGLSNNSPSNGLFFSWIVGFVDLNDTVGMVEGGNISLVVPSSAVPEPGTLVLFGTGPIAVAGFVRRRIRA